MIRILFGFLLFSQSVHAQTTLQKLFGGASNFDKKRVEVCQAALNELNRGGMDKQLDDIRSFEQMYLTTLKGKLDDSDCDEVKGNEFTIDPLAEAPKVYSQFASSNLTLNDQCNAKIILVCLNRRTYTRVSAYNEGKLPGYHIQAAFKEAESNGLKVKYPNGSYKVPYMPTKDAALEAKMRDHCIENPSEPACIERAKRIDEELKAYRAKQNAGARGKIERAAPAMGQPKAPHGSGNH